MSICRFLAKVFDRHPLKKKVLVFKTFLKLILCILEDEHILQVLKFQGNKTSKRCGHGGTSNFKILIINEILF
jgi:hypothetical protein